MNPLVFRTSSVQKRWDSPSAWIAPAALRIACKSFIRPSEPGPETRGWLVPESRRPPCPARSHRHDQYSSPTAPQPGRLGRHLSMLLEDGQIHRYSIRPARRWRVAI
jgi:hypothetical protein